MPNRNDQPDPTPDFTRFIDAIIARVPKCSRHPQPESGVEYDQGACFIIPTDKAGVNVLSVCHHRAMMAGYVGTAPPPKPVHSKMYKR